MKGVFLFLVFFFAPAAAADDDAAPPVVLLELFTSQGCYSCPPAEKLLAENYAKRADVLPLEFHVDYWDDLVYGLAGSWEDPFSSREYSERQFAYNKTLRGERGGFTPQMVVQGRHQSGGAQKGRIDSFIKEEAARKTHLRFFFGGAAADGLSARLTGNLFGGEDLYYAVFYLEKTTEIPSGENKGKTLVNAHIVKDFSRRDATRRQVRLPPINTAEEGCAVWVQRRLTGAVLSAARCPTDKAAADAKGAAESAAENSAEKAAG